MKTPAPTETIMIAMQPGLEEITPVYLEGRREEIPELIALLAASDFARVARLAHRIKGTGTSYGFVDLSRIGAALEAAADRMDPRATGSQLTQLNDYLCRVQVIAPELEGLLTNVSMGKINDRSLTNHGGDPC